MTMDEDELRKIYMEARRNLHEPFVSYTYQEVMPVESWLPEEERQYFIEAQQIRGRSGQLYLALLRIDGVSN